MNNVRLLPEMIRTICGQYQIEYSSLSDDWILHLSRQGRSMVIYGNRFPNNGASVDALCSDKAALSALLQKAQVPHVPHWYFPAPEEWPFARTGVWPGIQKLFDQYGALVCKDDTGTGGRQVYRVRTQRELEEAVWNIYHAGKALAVSPWLEIAHEYRVIVVRGKPRLMYEKIRQPGQWKHNLGQGAREVPVTDTALRTELGELAEICVKLLPLSFASIDLVDVSGDPAGTDREAELPPADRHIEGETEDQRNRSDQRKTRAGVTASGRLVVLEINTGVMMDQFAAASAENYETAREIYEEAVTDYFGL